MRQHRVSRHQPPHERPSSLLLTVHGLVVSRRHASACRRDALSMPSHTTRGSLPGLRVRQRIPTQHSVARHALWMSQVPPSVRAGLWRYANTAALAFGASPGHHTLTLRDLKAAPSEPRKPAN